MRNCLQSAHGRVGYAQPATRDSDRARCRLPRVQQFPGAPRVLRSCAQVADRETQDVAAVEFCVREEDFAGGVHSIEDPRVPFISRVVPQPEADDAEGHRRDALEAIARVDP